MVGEVIEHYKAHARQYYSRASVPTGEHVTIEAAPRPLTKREHIGVLPATKFGPLKLKQVREDMIARGWAHSTIDKAVRRIKLCVTWAASEEHVPAEIATGLKTV